MNPDHHTTLINTLAQHGISITALDIPQVLHMGIDTLLDRHGKELKAEDITVLHLIIFAIREENETVTHLVSPSGKAADREPLRFTAPQVKVYPGKV